MGAVEDIKNAARLWIDRLNNGAGLEGAWRLQRIDRRSRKGEGSEVEERPAKIRRFAKGIPANCVDEAVKYLISIAPYSDIVFNGTELEGTYAPTRTWWERDEGATVDRGQMRENTYTLYQDLVDWKNADSTDFDAGGSCSETVHMRYEYDSFSIENVSSGGQGVTVSIQAVSRNEDGTFNYAVVTRKAKTAIGTEQTVKCDEFQTVTQQVYQNLYGVEGAYTYDDGITPVSGFPDPCSDKRDGLLIEISSRKNDDCTYDVTVTKTQAKNKANPSEQSKQKTLRGVIETTVSRNVNDGAVEVLAIGDRVQVEKNPDGTFNKSVTRVAKLNVGDIGSSCQQTMFEHSHVKNENVVTRPATEAAQAGGGKTYQVQARATEEGTWDVIRTTTTELRQEKAQRSKQKTLRGVTETIVDRNVDSSDVTVTNIGDRVQVEMTPGGKWNRTVTRVIKEDVGDIGSSCQQTMFEHSHVENENVVSRPAEEAAQAGDGKTYQVQTRITEEGTWDVSRVTTTELQQVGAQHTKQKTLRGVTETIVDRNVGDNDVTVTNIGDRVQVEMTPGGKWNRTVTRVIKEDVGSTGSSCQQTMFEHSHVENENVATRPSEEAGQAGGGKTYQVQTRITEEGTWDVSRVTTTELRQAGAQHTKQKTLRGVTETIVDRNVGNNDVTVTNIGDRVQVEMTPGGKWNRTVTRVAPESVGVIGKSCIITQSSHTDVTSSNVIDGNQPEPQHQTSEVNVEKTIEIRRTEEGTWDVISRKTQHTAWGERTIAIAENVSQKIEFHAFQNLIEAPSIIARTGEDIDASVARNPLGSFDGTFRKRIAKPLDSGWITWESKQEMPSYTYEWEHGVRVFTNQQVDWVSSLVRRLSGKDGSVSAGINSFGLVDGTASYKHLKRWYMSAGGGGEGGSESGKITIKNIDGSVLASYNTIAFSGGGNSGAERHARANQVIVAGVSLPARTYFTE